MAYPLSDGTLLTMLEKDQIEAADFPDGIKEGEKILYKKNSEFVKQAKHLYDQTKNVRGSREANVNMVLKMLRESDDFLDKNGKPYKYKTNNSFTSALYYANRRLEALKAKCAKRVAYGDDKDEDESSNPEEDNGKYKGNNKDNISSEKYVDEEDADANAQPPSPDAEHAANSIDDGTDVEEDSNDDTAVGSPNPALNSGISGCNFLFPIHFAAVDITDERHLARVVYRSLGATQLLNFKDEGDEIDAGMVDL